MMEGKQINDNHLIAITWRIHYTWIINQRIDSHAQKEIQDLAKEVGNIIQPLFPVSWKALVGEQNE